MHLSMVCPTPPPPLLGLGEGEVGDCHIYDVTPTYGASVGHTLPHLPFTGTRAGTHIFRTHRMNT